MNSDLQEAQGYFDLGMFDESWLAIEEMPLGRLNDADVLLLRFEILAKTERWESLAAIADEVVRLYPEQRRLVELAAEAMRQNVGEDSVRETLEEFEAVKREKADWLYEQALQHARRRDFKEIGKFLRAAFEVDPELKLRALDDPDLGDWWEAM